MTDKEIIEGIAENNRLAFKYLVDTYSNMVYSTCYSFLHNADDADDISQEVFTEVYLSVDKFRGDAKVSTWLYRIAVNKSLNYLRKNKRKKMLRSIEAFFTSDSESEATEIEDSETANAENRLEQKETGKIIRKAINELAENQRIAFTLLKYQDMSYKEIAEIMNMSLSSIESLIFRARKSLQKKLIKALKQ